jgi:hypothetical protein
VWMFEVMAREILSDVDPWTAWVHKAQTMLVTLAGAGLLVYVASIPDRPFNLLAIVT